MHGTHLIWVSSLRRPSTPWIGEGASMHGFSISTRTSVPLASFDFFAERVPCFLEIRVIVDCACFLFLLEWRPHAVAAVAYLFRRGSAPSSILAMNLPGNYDRLYLATS